jgi:malonate-semialdehyde dehydrogenase (acetylating)/methylmalonate-semialdehyde dehydrogenase
MTILHSVPTPAAAPTTATPDAVASLIAGCWVPGTSGRSGEVYNPSTGKVIARPAYCSAADVDRAVQAAAAAFPPWAETPVVERARVMFRFRELLVARSDEIARLITREHGKTVAESKASLHRGVEVVEFACGLPSLLTGDSLPNIAREVDCETAREPLGVCVGITPFNFPAMVPLWMFPVALTCGNTFILKPSEKVPLTACRLAELLIEAGLPAGVFSVVHGDRECVDALLAHQQVAAASFVGSTAAARHVYETGTRNGKRVQAAGGAKNHMIIMPDADLEQAAAAIQVSAFGCAGERCMAGSVALPVGRVGDAFVEKMCALAGRMKVGPTDGGGEPDMGPVITREHRDRIAAYLDVAAGEGAVVAHDGRAAVGLDAAGFLIGPSVLDRVGPAMRVAREEIFGPVLSVIRADDLDAALAIGKACPYGNGASIFTRSGRAAREFKRKANAGMIGINVGVPAPMAWFPFTGWNQSFFGDLHIQGVEAVEFYTKRRTVLSRWFAGGEGGGVDPVWQGGRK